MATQLEGQLVEHLKDAHAMEANVDRMLDSMIATTEDPEIRGELEHHKEETQQHKQRLEDCLEAHGEDTSTVKDIAAQGGAFMKGLVDIARSDKPGRNARDGFVTEHLEIASYELLERVAKRAGDKQAAEAARLNRADEEAMAQKISSHWDKFVDLTLEEGAAA
jgi:ferritin-like metal-binding protein YciE